MFKHYKASLQFSDAIRYFLLYHYGGKQYHLSVGVLINAVNCNCKGVYLDMDMMCRKSLTQGLKAMNVTCIVDQERREISSIHHGVEYFAMNSAMACSRRHPFMSYVSERLFENTDGSKTSKYIIINTCMYFLLFCYFVIFSSR